MRKNEHYLTVKTGEYIDYCNMLNNGDRVLVAVSGGADSICLLDVLNRLSASRHYKLFAATVNHSIREEGASDVEFVKQYCRQLNIKCFEMKIDVPKYAKEHSQGLEEAARFLRYGFLREIAKTYNINKIAVAHNANDNAETVLLHLIRGSGLNGLCGILPVRDDIVRPLLFAERSEIEDYLRTFGISYVTDSTNSDIQYSRNYIRHIILPDMLKLNPNLLNGISEMSRHLRDDNKFLDSQAELLYDSITIVDNTCTISLKEINSLPESIFNRVIQKAMSNFNVVLSSKQRKAIFEISHNSNKKGKYFLSDNYCIEKQYDNLVIYQRINTENAQIYETLKVNETVHTQLFDIKASWEMCPKGKFNQPYCFYIKTCEDNPIILRSRKTGDYIELPCRDRKSVKKLMIDSKIPSNKRDLIPVFEIDGQVAALCGFGVDSTFLPKSGEKCIKIDITRN